MARQTVTWEEAKRCPKCQMPGEVKSNRVLSRQAGKLVMLTCKNSRCRWHETDWGVQVFPDGSVPVDTSPSGARPLPDDGGRTLEILERQAEAMKRGGAEIPRR
jgi:hypothetical protein